MREPVPNGGFIIWKKIQTKNGLDWRPVQHIAADNKTEATIFKIEKVVEVAANLACGLIIRGQLPAWKRRQCFRRSKMWDVDQFSGSKR